jgi:probable HAF family extracellular repeat protein
MWSKKTFASLFVCLVAGLSSAQTYTITDLGPLSPTGINSWAQVVGNYNNQAYIWAFGERKPLGILPGGTFSSAIGINDLGMVTGTADGPGVVTYADGTTLNCNMEQPFLWSAGSGMTGLGAPGIQQLEVFDECIYNDSYAVGINVLGNVAGSTFDQATYKYGFLWTKSSGWAQFLSGYQTAVNGIDDFGRVVGQTGLVELYDTSHAAVWVKGVMTDLGTLGGNSTDWSYCSGAYDINDTAEIVGWSTPASVTSGCTPMLSPGPVHAILWNSGSGMQDLGTLAGDNSSVAFKVNLFGQVIGSSGNTPELLGLGSTPLAFEYAIEVVGRPFIWTKKSGMQDLNTLIPSTSGWVLNTATGINLWGQIVGTGTLSGETHGFLLTPKTL